MLQPLKGQTFEEYANDTFLPYVITYRAKRIDVVWDVYVDNSLKEHTRGNRGKGKRRKVECNVKVPSNWKEFLRDSKNKTELFHFLSTKISSHDCDKILISTFNAGVHGNIPCEVDLSPLEPCSHEEAGTRLLVHVHHAQVTGFKNVIITVDTDVLAIAVSVTPSFGIGHIWLMFGTGNDTKYIDVKAVAERLGQRKAKGLPIFHAFTGCDSVSSFSTVGKKTAWAAWKACPEMNEVFAFVD